MATTTTNLGLTLPDNGEKVSRQIINTNNTLIDNAFSGVGAKIYDVTLEVSNVSGAYTGTVYDDKITASMRAIDIYAVDPSIFNDKIHVTCQAGYLTITCDDVVGTTDVTISVLKSANDPTALTSTEFDILSNRIGDLDDLTTTNKTNVVNAVNEVNAGLATANDHIATYETKNQATGAEYYRIGDVVIASILVLISNTAAWSSTILTGLPTPKQNVPITLRASSDGSFKTFYAQNDTAYFTLYNGSSAALNTNYSGMIAYIAK